MDALHSQACANIKFNHSTWRLKSGHRKTLVFLVDSTQKDPSTTDLTSQQREWVSEVMYMCCAYPNSALVELTVETLTMISEETDGTTTRFRAEEYREELMADRTVFTEGGDKEYLGFFCTRVHFVFTAGSLSYVGYLEIQYVVCFQFLLTENRFHDCVSQWTLRLLMIDEGVRSEIDGKHCHQCRGTVCSEPNHPMISRQLQDRRVNQCRECSQRTV